VLVSVINHIMLVSVINHIMLVSVINHIMLVRTHQTQTGNFVDEKNSANFFSGVAQHQLSECQQF